jgi:hypothetical protein
MTASILAKCQLELPFETLRIQTELVKVFPNDEQAWKRSDMARKAKGFQSPHFLLAYRNLDGSVFVMHSQGERPGSSTVVDVRIEPMPGTSARRLAEAMVEMVLSDPRLKCNRRTPQLLEAAVTALPSQDILIGRRATFRDIIGSSEFRIPAISGIAVALALFLGYWFVPSAERPSALWTAAPFLVSAVVAIALAWSLRPPRDSISWSVA